MPDFTPRPTVYKGIKMRSRLEAGYAQWLDMWRFDWEYEPQAFANENGQYLPDFRLHNVPTMFGEQVEPRTVYVEVKPQNFADHAALVERMCIIHASEPLGVPPSELVLQQQGRPPGLAMRGWGDHPSQFMDLAWAYTVGGAEFTERLVLTMGIGAHLSPWPDGYWNGPR